MNVISSQLLSVMQVRQCDDQTRFVPYTKTENLYVNVTYNGTNEIGHSLLNLMKKKPG